MPEIDFLQNSGVDFVMLSFYSNMIPVFIPFIAIVFAFIAGMRLFLFLEPDMVCELEDTCFRCHLLYGMSLGTMILATVFVLKDILSIAIYAEMLTHKHSLECVSNLMIKTGVFAFLTWMCIKGKECLLSICMHKNKKKEEFKNSKNGLTDDGIIFTSNLGIRTCKGMCYPVSGGERVHAGYQEKILVDEKVFIGAAHMKSGKHAHQKKCPSYLKSREYSVH